MISESGQRGIHSIMLISVQRLEQTIQEKYLNTKVTTLQSLTQDDVKLRKLGLKQY